MEAMLGSLEPNDSPTRLAEDEPRRHWKPVDERRQRMLQQRHQMNRRSCASPRGRTIRRNDCVSTRATPAGSNHDVLMQLRVRK
jgi:hypothetical protein